ncbi:type VI secretion system protein ImpK [Acinetobacter calcoaceticus]|uniref:Type VI secretion system protein ImpK n=1 Tax=Acinetobacter calcoaceticus TaxID=471 RepID=A0A4R1XWA7_ACICA|nr:type VI secretion system protein ImpK [Acinetobacter calcoaceticus]
MNPLNHSPSLFDHGQIGSGAALNAAPTSIYSNNLVDLLYDGFYIVFLLRNGYVPQSPEQFREKILELLQRFEQQAKKLQFSSEDIHDSKYAYCALLDETIVSQQDPRFFQLQNMWMINPLQLNLFGSQLAGYRFFEFLEQLRAKGKDRLASLEVFHYCMLLGFQGKYRLESLESLNHLVARVGDEIDYLKGKKAAFSPFAALPDQIRNIIHKELPFLWILIFLLFFTFLSFFGLTYMLSKHEEQALSGFKNIISAPVEQAHITIYLPE